jgi:ankyrin repeat protein
LNELGQAVRDGRIEDVRRLLDAGAEPNQTNFYGDTLIDMARDRGHDAIAALLEQACARARRVQPSETRADHPIHDAESVAT